MFTASLKLELRKNLQSKNTSFWCTAVFFQDRKKADFGGVMAILFEPKLEPRGRWKRRIGWSLSLLFQLFHSFAWTTISPWAKYVRSMEVLPFCGIPVPLLLLVPTPKLRAMEAKWAISRWEEEGGPPPPMRKFPYFLEAKVGIFLKIGFVSFANLSSNFSLLL